jgi:hypothetical protein
LQEEIKRFWIELRTDPELERQVIAAGLGSEEFSRIDKESAITIRVGTSGADPSTVVLIVALAPTANRVLKDLWANILLPRIKRRWGDDAVGSQRETK